MTFQKGQSGNPNGRPRKGNALADLLDKYWTEDDRIKILQKAIEQALDGDATARAFLFDRGYGRAPQSIDVDIPNGLSVEFSAIDLAIARNRAIEWRRNSFDARRTTDDEI